MRIVCRLTVFVAMLWLVACDKSDEIIPKSEIAGQLPKQVFLLSDIDLPLLYSIKYDTTNYLIEVYYDDTTNANPYDVLARRFQYNHSGYLVNWMANYEDGSDEKKIINRGSDNNIIWIAGESTFNKSKDTTWFSYTPNAEGTEIATITKTYYEDPFFNTIDSLYYQYDVANKLVKTGKKGTNYVTNYSYNNSGSLNNFTWYNGVSNLAYTSGLADSNTDLPLMIFLGRDYYLQNLKNLYPFNLFYDINFTVSSTDPYHPTKLEDHYTDESGQSVTEVRTYQYEMEQNRVSRVTIQWDGNTDWIRFKY